MIVDLFAGAGGWDVALASLGRTDAVGVELDPHARATRDAAGWTTHPEGDVTTVDPAELGDVEGLVASPPCQSFSLAGLGAGRRDESALTALVLRCASGWRDPGDCGLDPRAMLVLQPLRWVWALRPRWVALEQVPPVLGPTRPQGPRKRGAAVRRGRRQGHHRRAGRAPGLPVRLPVRLPVARHAGRSGAPGGQRDPAAARRRRVLDAAARSARGDRVRRCPALRPSWPASARQRGAGACGGVR